MRTTNHRLLTAMALAVGMTAAQPAAPDKFGVMKKRIEAPMVTGRRTFTQALGTEPWPCGAIF